MRREREVLVRPVEEDERRAVGEEDAPNGHDEREFVADPEIEAGSRAPRKLADPKLPDAEEVRIHDMTHLPYRSWCSHCVRGKGKALEHKKQDKHHTMGEVHVDYCFMGSAGDEHTKVILVAKEPGTKYLMSSVVPLKGASHEFPARRMCAFLRELGLEHRDVVLKSDQEAAIKDLLAEVAKKQNPANIFFEESPVGASASNGVIERGNQTVKVRSA